MFECVFSAESVESIGNAVDGYTTATVGVSATVQSLRSGKVHQKRYHRLQDRYHGHISWPYPQERD